MATNGTLTIGMDAKRIVRNATGLGNYGRTLVNDLAALRADGATANGAALPAGLRLLLYAPDTGRDHLRQQVAELPGRVEYRYPTPSPWPLHGAWWRTRGVVADLRRDGVSLYHGLTGELPHGLRRAGIRSVVTIHDLIFMRHPEYYHRADVALYKWKFRHACREADRIIAISERTKADIVELGGVEPERIDVVYQSCAPRYTAELPARQVADVCGRYGLSGQRFMLSVGTIEERKNIGLAVRALPLLPANLHLVAVGRPTAYAQRVAGEAQRAGVAHRLHLLHGVSDADLQALYQGADVFVYPSRYEGFGIPIIEAIQSRLPVVAATGSCLEEAGGPASLYVPPDDAPALAAAVARVLRGSAGRQERTEESLAYVRRFEGTGVASQVAAVYRRVLQP